MAGNLAIQRCIGASKVTPTLWSDTQNVAMPSDASTENYLYIYLSTTVIWKLGQGMYTYKVGLPHMESYRTRISIASFIVRVAAQMSSPRLFP